MPHILINGQEVIAEEHKTVLDAALKAGIYIPHLCFHIGLSSTKSLQPNQSIYHGGTQIRNDSEDQYPGCNLCLVEVEGMDGYYQSCALYVKDGMKVFTMTELVMEKRKQNLTLLLKKHPHACIQCDQAQGCDRKLCSMEVPEKARCCWKFGNCELQKVAEFIGLEQGTGYTFPEDFPIIEDNPLFSVNYCLCVGCLRCVIACRNAAERETMGFVRKDGRYIVGTCAPGFKESKCRFCLVCVEVCPTGALRDTDTSKKKSKIRLSISPSIFPPEKDESMPLDKANLTNVPGIEGVYQLYDKEKNVLKIVGVENLKEILSAELGNTVDAAYFSYEENQMYTTRERQLLQQYMKKHGDFPPGNREMDELFS
ncbi:MAG: 2Fe-2S iron-sulfur cluster-binding protein [Thermodesulfobacteriota bacterium]|nr:2Fe-2S iron-sulfur cluster-binding protein [Thermodesulfobacteriota bacterium]